MKKNILRVIAAVFAVIVAFPMCSHAAGTETKASEKDQIKLSVEGETVRVSLAMPHSKGEGLNAIRMSFQVVTNGDADVTFSFEKDTAGDQEEQTRGYISGQFYHKNEDGKGGLLNIYAASAGELFDIGDPNPDEVWDIGTIKVTPTGSEGVKAGIIVDPYSLQVVYGDIATRLDADKLELVYPKSESRAVLKIGNGGSGDLPEQSSLNKQVLRELLAQWDSYYKDKEEQYSSETYENGKLYDALEQAAAAAEKVLKNNSASQKEVNEAVKKLREALDALKGAGGGTSGELNWSKLDDILQLWETNFAGKGEQYDSARFAALEQAVEEAWKLRNSGVGVSQDDIYNAAMNIRNMMTALKTGDDPTDNLTKLKNLVEEEENIKESDYTAESYKAYQEAVKKGRELLEIPNPNPLELEEAVIAIQKAKAALIPKNPGGVPGTDGSDGTTPAGSSGEKNSDPAETGDRNNPVLWVLVALLALGIAGEVVLLRRRR